MNRFLVVSFLALACAEAKQSIRVSVIYTVKQSKKNLFERYRRKEMLYLKKSTERMLNQPREARYQSLPTCAQS